MKIDKFLQKFSFVLLIIYKYTLTKNLILLYKDASYRSVDLEPWPEEFYENSSNQDISIYKHLLWPKAEELEIKGNYHTSKSTILSLNLVHWELPEEQWDLDGALTFFSRTAMSIIVKSRFFDYTNLENPVQTYFRYFLFISIVTVLI